MLEQTVLKLGMVDIIIHLIQKVTINHAIQNTDFGYYLFGKKRKKNLGVLSQVLELC